MKKCPKCRSEKPLANFAANPNRAGGFSSWCLDCLKGRASEERVKLKMEAIEMLGGACQVCGSVLPHYCYDFHHPDQQKKAVNPSKLLGGSREKALREIKKCILVCSNCHRHIHYGEGE